MLEARLAENSSIKLIGLGGVGSVVARYLSIFLAAQNRALRLVLIDGDDFEPANASRMLFGGCGNKAAVVRDELLPGFAQSQLSLVAVEEFISADNVGRVIQSGDTVFLAVDNHATRKLANQHCKLLGDVCLISGGNDGVGRNGSGRLRRGTYGTVQAYVRRDGKEVTPDLERFHPEIKSPADRLPSEASCTELIVSVPQLLFANLAVASAMLNTWWLHLCGALHYGELVFDIAEGLTRPIRWMQ